MSLFFMHLRWMPLLAALPRLYTLSAHSWTFSQYPTTAKQLLFTSFLLKQFSRLMIEIYLPHILPILLHLAIMYHLMTFSNNLLDCWSSRNVKQVVTMCTQSNFMFCVQQIEHNLDTLNSVQIGHQPTGRLASFGTYRQELICAHAV